MVTIKARVSTLLGGAQAGVRHVGECCWPPIGPPYHPTTTNEGSEGGKWSDGHMSGEGGKPTKVSMLFNLEDDILVLHKEFRVILLYYRSYGAVC